MNTAQLSYSTYSDGYIDLSSLTSDEIIEHRLSPDTYEVLCSAEKVRATLEYVGPILIRTVDQDHVHRPFHVNDQGRVVFLDTHSRGVTRTAIAMLECLYDSELENDDEGSGLLHLMQLCGMGIAPAQAFYLHDGGKVGEEEHRILVKDEGMPNANIKLMHTILGSAIVDRYTPQSPSTQSRFLTGSHFSQKYLHFTMNLMHHTFCAEEQSFYPRNYLLLPQYNSFHRDEIAELFAHGMTIMAINDIKELTDSLYNSLRSRPREFGMKLSLFLTMILSVADFYTALRENRTYRDAFTPRKAFEMVTQVMRSRNLPRYLMFALATVRDIDQTYEDAYKNERSMYALGNQLLGVPLQSMAVGGD